MTEELDTYIHYPQLVAMEVPALQTKSKAIEKEIIDNYPTYGAMKMRDLKTQHKVVNKIIGIKQRKEERKQLK